MSLESLGYQYRPNHVKTYNLDNNSTRNPQDLLQSLKYSIWDGLDKLQNHGDMVARFVFRFPQETQALFLFQNELFNQLVRLHNDESEIHAYVHPYTLMMFDPQLGNLTTKNNRVIKNVRGEDAVQHELQHFLKLQELWKADAKGEIGFDLFWQEVNGALALTSEGGVIFKEKPNDADIIYALGGPLYPSDFDLKEIRQILLNVKGRQKFKNRTTLLQFNMQKMREQGINSTHLKQPLNFKQAYRLLFNEWRKLRKDKISFNLWDDLIKIKKL